MGLETFAIINDQNQVVNHIVVDKEAENFDEIMAGQLTAWNCVRYVETTETKPVILLHESPEIWTTHSDETGFVLPEGYESKAEVTITPAPQSLDPADYDREIVIIGGRVYPIDSLLIAENASRRPAGYTLPAGEKEVSLADKE